MVRILLDTSSTMAEVSITARAPRSSEHMRLRTHDAEINADGGEQLAGAAMQFARYAALLILLGAETKIPFAASRP